MRGKHARPGNTRNWRRGAAVAVVVAASGAVAIPAATADTTQSIPKMTQQQIVIEFAKTKINGQPYEWGGNGPLRYDCSGLTTAAWAAAGVTIPRTSQTQLAGLPRVARADIRPGDLVVWTFDSYADHVSLYTGPIGPAGADLIDTASRHPGGGVGWSTMATRGGAVAGIVRPAPVANTPATSPAPVKTTPPPTKPQAPHQTPPATSPAPGHHTVTVKPGDTLWALSPGHWWRTVYQANRATIGDNPNRIYPGQELELP